MLNQDFSSLNTSDQSVSDSDAPDQDAPPTLEDLESPDNDETTEASVEPTPEVKEAVYRRITPEEAQDMMSGNAIILDVRSREEFDEGHIPDAVLIPHESIGELAELKLPDKNRTILVYCRSGRRSEIAARELVSMGYTQVYDFGGIQDWHGEVIRNLSK